MNEDDTGWIPTRPCGEDLYEIRHTCRYEPPERRVFPCQGCIEELEDGCVVGAGVPSHHTETEDWPHISVFSSSAAATQMIHDHVREGRITPEQGSWLLELRRELRRAREPRWLRALRFLGRVLFG